MAYIYSIRKNRKGYIGLASGQSTTVDYQKTLGVRQPLDRMLQHIDNSYGLKSSYALAKGSEIETESSELLRNALRDGGACTCIFSYIDTEDDCFGVGADNFKNFSKIWTTSSYNAPMQFAEIVYIYHFRNSYSSWNNQPGSQSNYQLQIKGLFGDNWKKLDKYTQDQLEKISSNVTWSSKGFRSNDDNTLDDLFWPERLIAQAVTKTYNNEFASTADYHETIYKTLSDSSTWHSNITITDITQLMKNALDKAKVKENIVNMVENKLKKLEPAFQTLKDVLNIDVKKPDNTEISNYANKVCKALSDVQKKTDQIRIDNLITASYVQVKRPIPNWYPRNLILPPTPATKTVKIHCASRALTELQEHAWDDVVGFYGAIFGSVDNAKRFLDQSRGLIKRQQEGSLTTIYSYTTKEGQEWTVFGRSGVVSSTGKLVPLFRSPSSYAEAILDADRIYEISGLRYY